MQQRAKVRQRRLVRKQRQQRRRHIAAQVQDMWQAGVQGFHLDPVDADTGMIRKAKLIGVHRRNGLHRHDAAVIKKVPRRHECDVVAGQALGAKGKVGVTCGRAQRLILRGAGQAHNLRRNADHSADIGTGLRAAWYDQHLPAPLQDLHPVTGR